MTPVTEAPLLSRQDIEDAHERIRSHIHRTPVLTSSTFDRRFGGEELPGEGQTQLFFKCENFQKIGAFKIRGGVNALSQLTPEELERGVVTHSSGNHAQAISLAARLLGARAWIVMPHNAPNVKVAAVRGYGGEIVFCEPGVETREAAAAKIIEETGAVLVHAYNDRRIIAGQATAAKEFFEDVPGLDLVLVPVGGGGLASGTALSAHHFSPGTRVIAAEPVLADDAYRSMEAGSIQPAVSPPRTIADGLLTQLGDLTFAVIHRNVEGVVTVSEAEIVAAMRLVWERMKMVIEPSSAVPLAAVMAGKVNVRGLKVGIIISGGNVDLDALPWMT